MEREQLTFEPLGLTTHHRLQEVALVKRGEMVPSRMGVWQGTGGSRTNSQTSRRSRRPRDRHCPRMRHRLLRSKTTGRQEPAFPVKDAKSVKRKCHWGNG